MPIQAPGLDARTQSMPVRSVSSTKRPRSRQSTAPPPPYTEPPTRNVSEEALPLPHLSSRDPTPTPPRLPNPHETSRRLPTPPDPRIATPVERATASPSQPDPPSSRASRLTGLQSPVSQSSRASFFPTSRSTPSLSPPSHVNHPSHSPPVPPSVPIVRARSVFNPLSILKLHKSTRKATAQIANQAAWKVTEETKVRNAEEEAARQAAEQAAREREEEEAHQAAALAEARELVQSSIQSLLFRGLTSDEERISVLSKCFQACNDCGLNLSAVLQEPLIEGQIPLYWAILNRPASSPEVDDEALNALIFALLDACGSLSETTIDSVRLACMWTSNNALLQHLFWTFPELSPLSMSDRMLLGSSGGDVVDVGETRDGTGAFVADVKIRRFRLRMNSSRVIKIEFITFERIWTLKFFVSAERTREGSVENKWLFSLELANNSSPAWVNADLVVPDSHQAANSDRNEPVFSIPVGCVGHALQAGPENAIKVRLDDGPMRLHWVNESLVLLDNDGTLHAELHVRLTQPMVPPVPALSPDNSDAWSQVSSIPATYASSSHSEPQSPARRGRAKSRAKRPVEVPDKPVFTSLRKGGR